MDGRERNAFQLDSEAEACDDCRETGTLVARRIKSTNLLRDNVPRGSVARTTLSIARLVAGDVERRMVDPSAGEGRLSCSVLLKSARIPATCTPTKLPNHQSH